MSNWPIKYTTGSQPTKAKRKNDDKDTKKKEQEKRLKCETYEKDKRQRSFNKQWLKDKKWLAFDEEKGIMTCTWCTKYEVAKKKPDNLKVAKSLFVTGSTNFRFGTLNDHEKSSQHRDAESKKKAMEQPSQTQAAHGLLALHEHNRKQLELKFRNVHALAKANRPLKDFVWLNELDRAKGLDIGVAYNNQIAAPVFLKSIASVEHNKLADAVEATRFFSITMDGTTDNAAVEQETIFLRSSTAGSISTRFLCIGEPESTTSEALHSFVLRKLNDCNLSQHMDKFVGFGSDGAATMTGKRSGLITLLKKDYPAIVGVHCLAHRLELCFRDVFSKDKSYDKLITLLLGIYYFYKRSSKQRKGLQDTFKVDIFIILSTSFYSRHRYVTICLNLIKENAMQKKKNIICFVL